MKFKKFLCKVAALSLLTASQVEAAHTTNRSIYATDIVTAAGASIFKFPTSAPTASRVCTFNADGEATSSSVTTTTLGFLDATSSIQTQLDGKQSALTLPLSLANGGWGASQVATVDSANGTHNALNAGTTLMSGTSSVVVNGITALAVNGARSSVVNKSASSILVTHENASATAANRIRTPTSGTLDLLPGQRFDFIYDTAQSRWILVSGNSATGYTNPMQQSSTGVVSMAQATSSTNGWLSAADYQQFKFSNVQVFSGVAQANAVPFFTSTNLSSPPVVDTSNVFSYYASKHALRVGGTTGDEAGAIHSISDVSETISPPNAFDATLVQFVLPTEPTITALQVAPDIQNPGFSAPPTNVGSGNYAGGDTINYEARAGYDNGVDPIVWGVGLTQVVGVTDASNFDVQFALSGGGGILVANVWIISRSLNGGANDYIQTTNASYYDDGTGWGPEPDSSNRADDFLANSSAKSIVAYGTATTPVATTVVSASGFDPGFIDDGSGNAYKLNIQFSGGTAPYRVNWISGSRNYDTSNDFISGPIGPTSSGSAVLSPNSYGYFSDGNSLNKSYNYYATGILGGQTTYSSSFINRDTTDPSDGNYYYVVLNNFSPDGKLLAPTGAKIITGSPTLYDPGTTFPDSTSVTPSSYLKPAVLAQGAMASTGGAQLVVKAGTGETFTKLEFQGGDSTSQGYVSGSGGAMGLFGSANNYVRAFPAGGVTISSSSGTTQVSGVNAAIDASSTAALNFLGTQRLKWDADGVKINGASTGYISGLEVSAKSASYPAATFKGLASQSGNLSQWIDNSNSVLAAVTASGLGSFNGLLLGGNMTLSNVNIVLGTSTGTKIGTGTTQKLGFFNATPVVQQTGNPVTALTTLGLLASPTAVTEAQGGTAQTSYTQGDLLYASASNTLSKLAKNTSATRYISNTGTSNNPAWAQIDLSNGVTGSLASPTFTGTLSGPHIAGSGSTPTIAAGAGAGTTPTVSVAGTDTAGAVSVTTGTLPTGTNAVVATITFASSYGSAPYVVLYPANAATATLSGVSMVFVTATTTTFVLTSGTTALTAATAYKWNYHTIQ